MRAAIRASSRNIDASSGSFASWACRRLMATRRANPAFAEEATEMHRRHPPSSDLVVESVAADP